MPMEAMRVVGSSVPKLDAREKVTGSARYTGDLEVPGALRARLLRSPYAHARIVSIDSRQAEALPGVVTVLTCANAPAIRFTNGEWDATGHSPLPPDQVLFPDRVRYAGEPVAMVVAVDDDVAQRALECIEVEYDLLPVVTDPEAALTPGSPLVHPERGSNLAGTVNLGWGDVETGLAEADHVIERCFRTGRQKHVQMEPFSCIAQVDGAGRLTVWSPNQTPHLLRAKLARTFGLSMGKVRIITPPIGGAFGGRLGFVAEPYAVAAALRCGRPVRLSFDRMEDFIGTESRHPVTLYIRAAFRRDGTLTALDVRSYLNAGPYVTHSMAVATVHGRTLTRQYKCPNVRYQGYVVYTNAPPSGGFRGFGGPQAYFGLEQILDEIAEMTGTDRLKLRRRLVRVAGDIDPWTNLPVPDSAALTCIERGAATVGWPAGGRPGLDGCSPWRRGFGMGCVMWVSGVACAGAGMTEVAGAVVRLNLDGSFDLITGATDIGTGARTTLAQVVAEELGCGLDQVAVVMDDTDITPFDSGCHATRTLFVCGNAARRAAGDVRGQILRLAAELLEAAPDDLEIRGSEVGVRGVPQRQVSLHQVALHALGCGMEVVGRGAAPQVNSPPAGAHFAEVAVNVETGQVRILRYVAAHDVGRAINPAVVEGQIEGGVAQGIGFALTEELQVDPETGSVLNASFMDYKALTAADTPPIETVLIESPDPVGPFGAKGVGEPGIVPVAGVIANAIHDAVGVWIRELPITPERVLRALREQGVKP